MPHLVCLCVDQVVRDLQLGLTRRGVDHGLAKLDVYRLLLDLADALPELSLQLVERVVTAGLEGELVVELGQALLLDLLDLDREGGLLPSKVLSLVLLREGHLDLALLAALGAAELLFEAGDQAARAELEQVSPRLAALERLARHDGFAVGPTLR